MNLFRKKITEQKASAEFVLYIVNEAQDNWPVIYQKMRENFGEKFILKDEKMAPFDLALAAIAQELQAVKNLFPPEQATRIQNLILDTLNTEEWGEYSLAELQKYSDDFTNEVKNISNGGDPLGVIPSRLVHRWLGNNVHGFDVETNGQKTGFLSPVLIMTVSGILTAFLGTWKRIKEEYRLIE